MADLNVQKLKIKLDCHQILNGDPYFVLLRLILPQKWRQGFKRFIKRNMTTYSTYFQKTQLWFIDYLFHF